MTFGAFEESAEALVVRDGAVLVEWLDSAFREGYHDAGDAKDFRPITMYSVGWVVEEVIGSYITIALTRYNEGVSELLTIPWNAIEEIRDLGVRDPVEGREEIHE